MVDHHYNTHDYKAMLENMQDGFLYCRALKDDYDILADYEILKVNKSFRETLQITWEDLIGTRFSKAAAINSSLSFYLRFLSKCLKHICEDSIFELYNPFLQRWHSLSVFCERDKHYSILIRDITENKRCGTYVQRIHKDSEEIIKIEEQLKESQERWQFALEGSESGVWDWNIETGTQVFSRAWKGMLGYEEGEIGTGVEEWCSRIHPEDIEHAKKMTEDYLSGAILQYYCEHRLRCKDGQYKWILSKAKIMKRSPEGKPLRMTGTHTDITETKKLMEELKELTNDYEIVFNGTQDALFLVSVDEDSICRYIRLNNSHERLTGFTTEQVRGKTPQEVLGKRQGKKVEASYNRCIKEKSIIQYEEEMLLPAGKKTWYTRLAPVIKDGRVVYIIGSRVDITEQKSIEASKKRADDEIKQLTESIAYENLKTEFFSNLSHELRTPLNIILCAVQMSNFLVEDLPHQPVKQRLQSYTKMMKQNSYRLLRLVNNLIDITKMDSGYHSLQLENSDVVGFIEDIVKSIESYIQNKSIRLCFHSQVQERIMALDLDKVERIVLNLLSNAVKFTNSEGEIKVLLYENEKSFFISVKDNGIGIPEDKLDLIFERFTQVERSLNRSHEGSGIGLALVKSMAELHGGTVTVVSQQGLGSEFILELPITSVERTAEYGVHQSRCERDVVERINIEFSDIYS